MPQEALGVLRTPDISNIHPASISNKVRVQAAVRPHSGITQQLIYQSRMEVQYEL
jgi:hypothetical protein